MTVFLGYRCPSAAGAEETKAGGVATSAFIAGVGAFFALFVLRCNRSCFTAQKEFEVAHSNLPVIPVMVLT